jgi:hypothetical protein
VPNIAMPAAISSHFSTNMPFSFRLPGRVIPFAGNAQIRSNAVRRG